MADVWANSVACHHSHLSQCCRVLPLGEFTVTIPEPHATLQGAVSWRNQCHDRATLQSVRIPSALLSRRSRQRERLSAPMLSICLSVFSLSVHMSPNFNKTLFSQKLSNLELWCLLTTYRKLCNWLFKEPIIRSLKSKMAEIHHLENRHDVIFFCQSWSDLNKISQTGAE